MAYKLNGVGLPFDVPFTHNETNYPANWLRLSTEEDRKASRINSTSALENAETSAVGRMAAFLGVTNDNIASAEEVSLAIEQQDKKLQAAMKELKAVSHAGSYQQWLTNYKTFLAELKSKNPIGYQGFMEQFTSIKNQLKSKGVLQ